MGGGHFLRLRMFWIHILGEQIRIQIEMKFCQNVKICKNEMKSVNCVFVPKTQSKVKLINVDFLDKISNFRLMDPDPQSECGSDTLFFLTNIPPPPR